MNYVSVFSGELHDFSWCGQLSGDLRPLAGLTSLQTLDFSWCGQLSGDLRPLAGLTSLQRLHLSWCMQLSGDLRPLTGLTSLQTLNLSRCEQLSGDLRPLAGMTSLQTLELSWWQLTDLSPLAGLTSLQTLYLSSCGRLTDLSPLAGLTSLRILDLFRSEQLTDLRPLAGLTSLQILNLSGCNALRQFDPVKELLPSLQALYLFGCKFNDLPSEVCGEFDYENVLAEVHAHYEDLKAGQRHDAEVKVLFLGNGGTGKTQLCRRLRGQPFDPSVLTTHGIQLSEKAMELEDFPEPVQLNLWDFGGQEVYHGSHALFLQGQAVFFILWTPELECQRSYQEGDVSLRHRPLAYWLDYLRAFAGVDGSVLLIQSQCDTPAERAPLPLLNMDDFTALQRVQVSAKTNLGLDLVTAALKEAVRDCLYRRPPPPIGAGRVRVRDRLRELLAEDQKPLPTQRHQLLERADFDRLCDEEGEISDKEALLNFLHHSGVIFYQPGLFGGRIVLDQNWALEAIYALFDRKKILALLRGYGRFTRADLEALIWYAALPKPNRCIETTWRACRRTAGRSLASCKVSTVRVKRKKPPRPTPVSRRCGLRPTCRLRAPASVSRESEPFPESLIPILE